MLEWDAFQETGDGLSGLEENFNEMLTNIVKQQASARITGDFIKKITEDLGKYINENDLDLTQEEAMKWAEKTKELLPGLNESLENAYGAIAEIIGEAQGGTLSGLEKGIGSMTEETAEILAAYANSIRFINQASDDKLAAIQEIAALSASQQGGILEELRSQTKYLQDIYDFLSGLTTSYPNGGVGFKVVI